jgi:ubiquinone/menaquinone biosynthesis C-methylase UbiE
VVIKQQASKYPEQIWKVANALNMDFPDSSFPVVIDKSLIDTLLCASGR